MSDVPIIEIEVDDPHSIEPWRLDSFSILAGCGRWVKTYISITDYNEDGSFNYDTQEQFRVRTWKRHPDGSVSIGICHPEDDDEPDVFPGISWRD